MTYRKRQAYFLDKPKKLFIPIIFDRIPIQFVRGFVGGITRSFSAFGLLQLGCY